MRILKSKPVCTAGSILAAAVVGGLGGYLVARFDLAGWNISGLEWWRLPGFLLILLAAWAFTSILHESGHLLLGKLSGFLLLCFHIGPITCRKLDGRTVLRLVPSTIFSVRCDMRLDQYRAEEGFDENASCAAYYAGGLMASSLQLVLSLLAGVLFFPADQFIPDTFLLCCVMINTIKLVLAMIPVRRSDGQMVLELIRHRSDRSKEDPTPKTKKHTHARDGAGVNAGNRVS